MVAKADGSDLHPINTEPVQSLGSWWWSPDGTSVVFDHTVAGEPAVSFAMTDGSGVTDLATGMPSSNSYFLPPEGTDVLFRGEAPHVGLYTIPAAGGTPTLVYAAPSDGAVPLGGPQDLQFVGASPDGTHIVYSSAYAKPGEPTPQYPLLRIHLVNADGTGDHIVDVLDAEYERSRPLLA